MYVSAGHSNVDPGAVAFGRKEADIVCEFRNMVSFYLTRNGVPHEIDGDGTENLPLSTVVKRSKLHSISVEFHCNAASPSARGTEALCRPKDTELANRLCAAVSDILDTKNRGAKPENAGQHQRLAFVSAGGIILELFFITSQADLAAYDEKKWLAARAVASILTDAART